MFWGKMMKNAHRAALAQIKQWSFPKHILGNVLRVLQACFGEAMSPQDLCPASLVPCLVQHYLSESIYRSMCKPNNLSHPTTHDKWQMSSIAALCPCESNLPKCCRYCCPGKCNASLRCARQSPESETPTKWYYCACVSAFIHHKHQTKSRSVNYVGGTVTLPLRPRLGLGCSATWLLGLVLQVIQQGVNRSRFIAAAFSHVEKIWCCLRCKRNGAVK